MPSIRNFLELSTGHLSVPTRNMLDADAAASVNGQQPNRWVAGYGYGWFIYANEEPYEDIFPPDLIECMEYARKNGCDYILFDRDAPFDECLPTYED